MKKVFLLATMALCSISLFSQKIEKSVIDDFTGNKVIYTSWEKIKSNQMTGQNQLMVRFRYENKFQYFELKWISGKSLDNQSGIVSVKEDAKLMLKLSNNEVVTLNSIEYSIAEKGAGTTGLSFSALYGLHLKYISNEMSKFLEKDYVTKVRIYTTEGYVDIDIKDKDGKKVNELYNLFISEVEKTPNDSTPREKTKSEDDF